MSSQVPPEILSVIFLLHQSICRESEDEFEPWANEPQWIATAQVCQAWRETALSLPELWCSIELSGRRNRSTAFQNMQLERSQGRLLTVQCFLQHQMETAASEYAIETVLSLTPRLKVLKLVSNRYELLRTLLDRFKSSPELVSLTVNCDDDYSLSLLSGGGAPRLQLLHLVGGMQIPESFGSNSLAHLRLGSGRMGSFVLWLELCEALRPLENTLKTLALDVHLQDVPTPFDQDPPLHLSQLEELALCQPPDVICQLLGFIRLPTSTKLYFQNVQPHGLDRLAFPKILSAVSTFHSPATSLQLSQLSLYVKYNSRHPIGEVEIKGYFHDQPIGFNRDWNFLTEPPSITLEQRNVLPEEIDSILSLSIDEGIWGISGYSISELENLELMLGVGWRQGPQFLWDTLAQLPKLKNIRIRNTIPGGLFISLGQDSESIRLILEGKPKEVAPENSDPPKSQSPQRERSFASLCSITFENVKFYRTPKNDPSTKAIGQLLGNLRLRHELGCPLERLAFRGCQSVRKAELVELARYVSELEK